MKNFFVTCFEIIVEILSLIAFLLCILMLLFLPTAIMFYIDKKIDDKEDLELGSKGYKILWLIFMILPAIITLTIGAILNYIRSREERKEKFLECL